MATSKAQGTQTAIVGTEHTLLTTTDAGSYVLLVDTNNMVLLDKLTLRIKTRASSGGVTRLAYSALYANVQGEPIKISIPVASVREFIATLEQTAGTARNFDFEITEL